MRKGGVSSKSVAGPLQVGPLQVGTGKALGKTPPPTRGRAECGAEAARQPVAEGDGRGPWRDGGVGEALHVASSIPAGHLREA